MSSHLDEIQRLCKEKKMRVFYISGVYHIVPEIDTITIIPPKSDPSKASEMLIEALGKLK